MHVHIYIYTNIHTYTHIHIYIYLHIYIYTYIIFFLLLACARFLLLLSSLFSLLSLPLSLSLSSLGLSLSLSLSLFRVSRSSPRPVLCQGATHAHNACYDCCHVTANITNSPNQTRDRPFCTGTLRELTFTCPPSLGLQNEAVSKKIRNPLDSLLFLPADQPNRKFSLSRRMLHKNCQEHGTILCGTTKACSSVCI